MERFSTIFNEFWHKNPFSMELFAKNLKWNSNGIPFDTQNPWNSMSNGMEWNESQKFVP